jgi:hypothetical protein
VGSGLRPYGKVGGRYLTGLMQKVCLLGPRLAIGWTGSPTAARKVLNAIRERSDPAAATGAELGELLRRYDFKGGKLGGLDLSIIGMSLIDDRTVDMFSFAEDITLKDEEDYGPLSAAGSGTEYLFNEISRSKGRSTSWIGDRLTAKVTKDSSPLSLNISKMLAYATGASIDEVTSGATLRRFFGGGFELAYPADGIIQKLDGITYVFWPIRGYNDKMVHLSSPNLIIINFSYAGSSLIVRRLLPNSNVRNLTSGRRGLTMRAALYVIPSLLDKNEKLNVDETDNELKSKVTCSAFIFVHDKPLNARITIDIGSGGIEVVSGQYGKTRWTDIEWNEHYFDCLRLAPGDLISY